MPFQTIKNFWHSRKDILGLNQRNVEFILQENDRKLYPWVDDKHKTKKKLAEYDLATPKLIAIISTHREVGQLENLLNGEQAFAIKPTQGSCGGGIVIVVGRTRRGFRKPNGQILSLDEVAFHMHNILSGLYSLDGQEDKVIIESLIRAQPVIPDLPMSGVPDVRILLYRGVPVAAMLRLPTYESDGKANLHIGGIGVGIDVTTGITTEAVHRNRFIQYHPEFDLSLLGHRVPHWEKIIWNAVHVYDAIPLGYMGIDLVIDQQYGPLILEANARPGISIQLANRWGLMPRLRQIQDADPAPRTLQERLDFAMKHFSQEQLPVEKMDMAM